MSNTANLVLDLIEAAQAQKHVSVNESLLRLDALVLLSPLSATLTAQPGAPSDGAVYILPSGKTGAAWGAAANHAIAHFRDGVWQFYTPRAGWVAFIRDTAVLRYFDGTQWSAIPATGFGFGTAANRNTGTSGATVPLLDGANTWSAQQNVSLTAANVPAVRLLSTDAGNLVGPLLHMMRDSASPAVGDGLASIHYRGRDGAGNEELYCYIYAMIADPVSGSEDANLGFGTVVNGSLSDQLIISSGVVVGNPTGGARGAGSLNAQAVFDDNVLLTCMPVRFAQEGKIDLAYWDSLVPDRLVPARIEERRREVARAGEAGKDGETTAAFERVEVEPSRIETRSHPAARLFAAMVETGFDPRDPANFVARLRADRDVPGLMTEAEWQTMLARGEKPDMGSALTRTFLALDNLAVAFAGLLDRVVALEAQGERPASDLSGRQL